MGLFAINCSSCHKAFLWQSSSAPVCEDCLKKTEMPQETKMQYFTVRAELIWVEVEYSYDNLTHYGTHYGKPKENKTTGTLERKVMFSGGNFKEAHEYGQKLADNLLEEARLTFNKKSVGAVNVFVEQIDG